MHHPRTRPARRWRRAIAGRLIATGLLLPLLALAAPDRGTRVHLVDLAEGIGPASADFVIRSLETAQAEADLFVIRMDTPGGLDAAMRDIIKAILASDVPVITYVAPEGSRAASAGAYILYASHVAAMAPATNVGSMTPVSIGGGGAPSSPIPNPMAPEPRDGAGSDGGGSGADREAAGDDGASEGDGDSGTAASDGDAEADPEPARRSPGSAMERKVINDAVAYVRGLAELRGRNGDWAEVAVREGANIRASRALELDVIDLVARDLDDLFEQIDGRTVEVDGEPVTLGTTDVDVRVIEKDWRAEFLATITNPSVAYLLLLAGVYGLLIEFYNPGFGIAGITGAICLVIGAYALQLLPINYAGLGLIGLGLALMVAEALTPTLGVLGGGGVLAFVIGSIILMDTDLPGYQISLWLIAGTAATSVLILTVVLAFLVRSRRTPVSTGATAMIGEEAIVLHDFEQDPQAPEPAVPWSGRVRLQGEIWHGRSTTPLHAGDRVTVVQRSGMDLHVVPERESPEGAAPA